MKFWDLFTGYVGLPLTIDFFGKIGVTNAAKEAIDRMKIFAETEYLKRRRQATLWLIAPLRKFHTFAICLHVLVLAIATLMTALSEGSAWKYAWLSATVLSIVVHAWMFMRLPSKPEYLIGADGEVERFPEKLPGTDDDDPFAGQKMLADDYELEYERVSLPFSVGWTIVAGFATAIPLLVLTAYTGRIGFIFLSLAVAGFSIASLNIVAKLFNWALVKGARLAERSLGFVFMQAAILLPHVTADDVSSDVADNLIPEQDFLPWYIKNRDFLVDTYLLFVLGLLLSPNPEMFQWIAVALTILGVTAHFMSRVGLGDEVRERQRRFYRTLFFTVAPLVIFQGFLRMFRPDLSEKIAKVFATVLTGIVNMFVFMSQPCDRIGEQGPYTLIGFMLAFAWLATKAYAFQKKAEGKFATIGALVGMVLATYVSVVSLYGAVISYQPAWDMCVAAEEKAKPEQEAKPAASAEFKEEVAKAPKKEEVTEGQTLAFQTVENQRKMLLDLAEDIGRKIYMQKLTDDSIEIRRERIASVDKLRDSLKALGVELNARDAALLLSDKGIDAVDTAGKTLSADVDPLGTLRTNIMDSSMVVIPAAGIELIGKINKHVRSAIASISKAELLHPEDEEAVKLADQRKRAKAAQLRAEAMEKSKAEAPKSEVQQAQPVVASRPAAKSSDECINCDPAFAALVKSRGIK